MKTKFVKIALRYKELILYGLVGFSTTFLNLLLYYLLTRTLHMEYLKSNIIAYIIALIYAFFSNKLWVFKSKSFKKTIIWYECISFFSARSLAGVLDSAFMYFGVETLHVSDTISKLITTTIIIILNYIFSKFLIFNRHVEHAN